MGGITGDIGCDMDHEEGREVPSWKFEKNANHAT